MATITANEHAFGAEQRGRSFFRRGFDRVIKARQRHADRLVAAHLLSLDDASLEKLGYTRAEVKRSAALVLPAI